MGAWDVGTFDNDNALDWVHEFLDNPGLDALRDALDLAIAVEDNEDLPASSCSMALAAAEMVAALRGRATPKLPEELAAWVDANKAAVQPDERLLDKARRAVARVQARSELKELWDEAEDAKVWQSQMNDLAVRLT
jgi:hypothetical protein